MHRLEPFRRRLLREDGRHVQLAHGVFDEIETPSRQHGGDIRPSGRAEILGGPILHVDCGNLEEQLLYPRLHLRLASFPDGGGSDGEPALEPFQAAEWIWRLGCLILSRNWNRCEDDEHQCNECPHGVQYTLRNSLVFGDAGARSRQTAAISSFAWVELPTQASWRIIALPDRSCP